MKYKQLTVEELIKELEKAPPDLFVKIEGCDCYQEAGAVEIQDGFILVRNIDSLE